VGEVELYFVEYSASKKVHLRPDIVEYPRGGPPPLSNLIIGKQTLHDIGTMLDFNERTITINEILLPMRNINNLQLKPSISRALKLNSSFAQEPASTHNTTKRIVEKSWTLLEIFLHRSIHQILQILINKVKEDQIRNEKVRKMFYSIPCVQNIITARQANFIGKMIQGPPDQPSRNIITACCNHKQRVG
jgi:hypothetical protein